MGRIAAPASIPVERSENAEVSAKDLGSIPQHVVTVDRLLNQPGVCRWLDTRWPDIGYSESGHAAQFRHSVGDCVDRQFRTHLDASAQPESHG